MSSSSLDRSAHIPCGARRAIPVGASSRRDTGITIALTTTIGIVIWNTLLNVTYATWLNVDSPFLGLCVQDVGSGVGAFLVTALVLRFVTNEAKQVGRVLAA